GEESWQKLETAGLYLLTGEFVFDMLKMAHTDDYSPASLGFVKALETFLNQRIVWHTESWLGCPPKDIRKKLQQDFKKAEKGRSTPILLQALEQSSVARGYALSCGELAGVFREIKTRNKDWRAYHLLRKFLSAKSDRFLQQSFYDLLDQVSNYRNGAVHTKALNFQAMERCRNLILPEIKFL
ncbi:hypothetical protein GWN42_30820, partial [candidate division KSB1 bacterium]|nr:hypothetical protein [candidate division KSB1 bacterium]NIR73048.1 hypothetical protein [candidate division KSB1 bacterium]NIS25196.1 hypothetical protein [candidate division KSB1 bacterium]NIU25904.1 hypothetical protein [candidate division KSB1 bacterium]NIU92229.1 hypothetical protein [candidate division KSB1 bacterium]